MKGFLRYLGSVLIGRLRKLIGLRSFPRCQFLLVLRASRIVFGLFTRSFFYRHLCEKWNYAQVTDSFIFQIVNQNSLFTTRYNSVDHEDFSISKKIFHVFLSVYACVFVSVQCNRKSIFDFVLVSNTKGNE